MKRFLHNAAVGDCLCQSSSGEAYVVAPSEWGGVPCGDTCVGVVFSLRPAAFDVAAGYAHGYAVALEDAACLCQWAADSAWERRTLFWRRRPRCSELKNPDSLFCREGLRNSSVIGNDRDYPAFFAAACSCGLRERRNVLRSFLPSAGQWIEMIENLACVRLSDHSSAVSKEKGLWSCSGNEIAAALNRRFAEIHGAPRFLNGERDIFWSSTPAGNRCAYALVFYGGQDVVSVSSCAASSRCRVRAAIAF